MKRILPVLLLLAVASSAVGAGPTLSSISPTSTTTCAGSFSLTLNGTNFANNAKVNFGATQLTPTTSSSTQLVVTVPASSVATAGTVSVTVVNPGGGGGTSNAQTFTINNPPPPVISSGAAATGTVGVAFTYQIVASNCPTSYNATGLPSGLTVNTSTGLISGTPTTAGTYSVTISATNAGGTGSATLTLTIKPPAPVITSPATATGQVGVAFSYQITATNNPTSYNATGLPAGLTVNTSTGLISGTPTTAGTYSVTISATNSGGTGSATLTLTINPAKPVITSSLTATGQVGVAFSYQITATNNPTSYNATGLPAGLTVNPSTGVISGTPTTTGIYSVTISATNSGGTGTATLIITINNPVPTTTSISPNCATAGSTDFTLTVTGTKFVSGSVVNFGGTSLTPTSSSSTQLTVTVPASLVATAGTVSVTVVNPSPGGGTSNAQTFTIANTPVITSPLTATGTVGVAFSYTITATNNPTTYTVTGTLPPGVTQGNGSNRNVISGTPTAAGTYSVTITVSNGGGACKSASATLVITICPDAPSITSSLTASATLGTPFSYQITADNSPISFDATDLPGGLTVCHNSSEGCTPGLISGTPTALGVFPVIISATSANTGPCGSSTATDTLALTITLPSGTFIPPFPGQTNVFNWGTTPPSANATIPFPNPSTNNSFVLYWNAPGSNTNQSIADSANSGLQRNQDLVGMQLNQYTPPARPDPTKNVWRGNPIPPNDNTSGQFGDPRASWYVSDPWPTADYASSYWGGPNPNIIPSNWPDSGHRFSYTGLQPTGKGQYPTDIMAGTIPTPDPTKTISLLSTSTSGNLTSITELGNVWDPAQMTYTVTNPGGPLPDIPTSASSNSRGAGGHTLAIGRPEFSKFDQNGMRAWQLLDVFSAKTANTNFTNTAGLVNINTASRDVLRSLAVGILENRDPAIQPPSLLNNLYPPTVSSQADKFADAVINSRPLLSTAALSAIKDSQGQPFFGNPNQYNNQTVPTEWNDPGREELFAKIYNLATTRSRNFRVFVTGQALDKSGNVLSTVTKVYQVFVKPNRDPATGAIQSQQVVIKYEGSM